MVDHETELCGELVPRLFDDDVWPDIDRLGVQDTILVLRQAQDVIRKGLFDDLYNDTTCRKDVFEAATARLGIELCRKVMALPEIYTLTDDLTRRTARDARGGIYIFTERDYADYARDYHLQALRLWRVKAIRHKDIYPFLNKEFISGGASYAVINDGQDWSINKPEEFFAFPPPDEATLPNNPQNPNDASLQNATLPNNPQYPNNPQNPNDPQNQNAPQPNSLQQTSRQEQNKQRRCALPLKSGTLRERIREMIDLAGKAMGRPADISRLRKLYDKENVPLLPCAERFLERYAYLFSILAPAFENEDDDPEFYFDTFDELTQEPAAGDLHTAYTDDWRIKGISRCPVTPVGVYGFGTPGTVYAGEDGKLYSLGCRDHGVSVHQTIEDLLEEALRGHLPIGLDD